MKALLLTLVLLLMATPSVAQPEWWDAPVPGFNVAPGQPPPSTVQGLPGSSGARWIGEQRLLTDGGAAGALVVFDGSTWRCPEEKSQKLIVVTCPPYNALADGSNQTTQLQAAVDAVEPGGTLYFPNGIYGHDGSLTLTPVSGAEITVRFGGGAWLAPSAGWGLKIVGNHLSRLSIENFRMRINTGTTATRGLWITDSWRVRVSNPTIWAYDTIPANFVSIDVDALSLWVDIHAVNMNKESGGISGTFSRGIRYLAQSNAGRVWGGNIANADVGVYVDGSANVEVIGVACEVVTTCVTFAEPTAGGNSSGGVVAWPRFESVTTGVLISQSSAYGGHPWQVVGGLNLATTYLSNPNAQPVYTLWVPNTAPAGILIGGNDQSVALRNGAVQMRDSGGNGFVEANGNVTIRGDLDASGSGEVRLQTAAGIRLTIPNAGGVTLTAKAFANLGTPANGTIEYCSDCTVANPCAGSGTGALAKRLNGAWVCN